MADHGHEWVITEQVTKVGENKISQVIARSECRACGKVIYGPLPVMKQDTVEFSTTITTSTDDKTPTPEA